MPYKYSFLSIQDPTNGLQYSEGLLTVTFVTLAS